MSDGKIKILVLTAGPRDLTRLDLEEEVRQITHRIGEAEFRERFTVVLELAARRSEVIELLLRHKPNVVHFSGHGKEGAIFLISDDGSYAPVPTEALKAIFAEFKDTVQLVFLNACYTALQAEAIAEVVGCAVGSENPVSDRAAIAFAASFYSTLAYGTTIGQAFNLGKAQLTTLGLQAEADPKLLAGPGVLVGAAVTAVLLHFGAGQRGIRRHDPDATCTDRAC